VFYFFGAILLYWAVAWFFLLSNLWFSPITLQVNVFWIDSREWPQAVFLFNCYKLDFINARTTGHFLQFGLCNNSLFEQDVLVIWISYPKHHLFNDLTCTLHKWHERPPKGPFDFPRIQFWAYKRSLETVFSLSMRPIYVQIGMEFANKLNLIMVTQKFCFRFSFWDMAFPFQKCRELPCRNYHSNLKKNLLKKYKNVEIWDTIFWFNICILNSAGNDKCRG